MSPTCFRGLLGVLASSRLVWSIPPKPSIPKCAGTRQRAGGLRGSQVQGGGAGPTPGLWVIHIKHWAPLFLPAVRAHAGLCCSSAVQAPWCPAASLITALPAPAPRAFEVGAAARRPRTPVIVASLQAGCRLLSFPGSFQQVVGEITMHSEQKVKPMLLSGLD